jgi:hypothetical protein
MKYKKINGKNTKFDFFAHTDKTLQLCSKCCNLLKTINQQYKIEVNIAQQQYNQYITILYFNVIWLQVQEKVATDKDILKKKDILYNTNTNKDKIYSNIDSNCVSYKANRKYNAIKANL